MGRRSMAVQEAMPAPTQEIMPAPTEALPVPEASSGDVPVSTEDLFAKRPRTKKDWVKKGRASKGSESKASKRSRPVSKAPPIPATEELPPTQQLAPQDAIPPTQDVMPATQLAQETPSEHSEHSPEAPNSESERDARDISPTQRQLADVEVVYGKCKRRRVKTSEGPAPAVGTITAIPSFAVSKPRRTSGMTFQDFVAMGKLKRGDPAPPGALEPEEAEKASEKSDDGGAVALDQDVLPATQKPVEDTLPPTQMLMEDSLLATQPVMQDEPVATEQLDQAAPVATEKLEEAPVATEKLEEVIDLHALLQNQISEWEEVSVQMTQRKKAMVGVYKALQAMLS